LTGSDKFIRGTEPEVSHKGFASPLKGHSGDFPDASKNQVRDGYTSRGAYKGKKSPRHSPSKKPEYSYELKESDHKPKPTKVDHELKPTKVDPKPEPSIPEAEAKYVRQVSEGSYELKSEKMSLPKPSREEPESSYQLKSEKMSLPKPSREEPESSYQLKSEKMSKPKADSKTSKPEPGHDSIFKTPAKSKNSSAKHGAGGMNKKKNKKETKAKQEDPTPIPPL
jgi:hypothetical protein